MFMPNPGYVFKRRKKLIRSKPVHLAASRTGNISIPQRLQDEGFELT
jgi:hypothetical protein